MLPTFTIASCYLAIRIYNQPLSVFLDTTTTHAKLMSAQSVPYLYLPRSASVRIASALAVYEFWAHCQW